MMIQYALHESAYLDAAKYYHKVWETPSIKEEVNGRGREACTSGPKRRCFTHFLYIRLSNTLCTMLFLHHMTTSNPTCFTVCSSTPHLQDSSCTSKLPTQWQEHRIHRLP